MKASEVSLLRSLANKIHPQIALSRKESETLLNGLKASFRTQLANTHPVITNRTDLKPNNLTYTEKHVASILTYPLLATCPAYERPNSIRHPITILEDSIHNGAATVEIVKNCLLSFRRSLRQADKNTRHENLLLHRAGEKTLRWLWANKMLDNGSIKADDSFWEVTVFFLLRENKEELLYQWLDFLAIEAVRNMEMMSWLSIKLVQQQMHKRHPDVKEVIATFTRVASSHGDALNLGHWSVGAAQAILRWFSESHDAASVRRNSISMDNFLNSLHTFRRVLNVDDIFRIQDLRLRVCGAVLDTDTIDSQLRLISSHIDNSQHNQQLNAALITSLYRLSCVICDYGTNHQRKLLILLAHRMETNSSCGFDDKGRNVSQMSALSKAVRNLEVWTPFIGESTAAG